MSRGLHSVFFALILAFAAVAASAGPDDLFDARVAGALKPGQQELILALDGGRYTLADGHFRDSRPVDAARPLLTNRQVAELLAGKGSAIPPLPAAAITPGVAVQPDSLGAKRVTAVVPNFDGGLKRAGDIRGPPPSGSGGKTGVAPDPAVLQARFLKRLTISGGKKEREALAQAVESILKTKTGRELAQRFVDEGGTAEVAMGVLGDGKAIDKNGKKVLSGVAGTTATKEDPPKVTLSAAYMDTDAEFRRVAMAGTLAHELFGHAFEKLRSVKAGLPEIARHHYRGDEVGSRLIDWLVQTELNGTVVDSDPGGYLEDPEGYYRGLLTVHPYYAVTLSLKEMKNPSDTLRARREMIASETAANDKELAEMQAWAPVIKHFVAEHKIAKSRFKTVEASIKSLLDYEVDRKKTLAEIDEALKDQLDEWATADGKKEKARLIAAADDPYLKRQEAAAAARAKALRKLRQAASGETALELPGMVITVNDDAAAAIDLAELGRMLAQDKKKNPGHWKK